MTDILDWALKYQKFGYSIIPVGRDKKPLLDWKKYQNEKADEAQVREWFGGATPPNIAIVTGGISGCTVVDIEKGGKWEHYPSTMAAKTGGGGYHLYYKFAPEVTNKARIQELTDIRGEGGYVIAPPSLHASGVKYEWFKKETVQPFPYKMFEVIPTYNKKDWGSLMQGVGEGSRNQSAASVIGKFLSVLPPEEWSTTAWQMFVIWNDQNNPALPERELRTTYNSILGRAVRGKQAYEQKKQEETGEDCDVKLISEIAKDITDDMAVKYSTGIMEIDKAFKGGFKEGDLVFISGYTGMGKTTLAQSITFNMVKQGQPIMWFTFEVGIGELWRKFKDMGVGDDFQAYAPEKNISQKLDWVKKKIIEARDRYKTKVVIIDHVGFLVPDSDGDNKISANYAFYIEQIVKQLKGIAINEGMVVILLGHLRKPSNSSNLDANVHDIKDSASIGQYSDAILFIGRKRVTDRGYGSKGDLYESASEVKIEKNRAHGGTAVFYLSMQEGRLKDFDEKLSEILG